METCTICEQPIDEKHPRSRSVDGKLQFAHAGCAEKVNAVHKTARETKILDGNRIVWKPATADRVIVKGRVCVEGSDEVAGFVSSVGDPDEGCWWVSAALKTENGILEANSVRLFDTEAEAQAYHAAHGYPVVAWKIIGETHENETESTGHEPAAVRGPEAAVDEEAKTPKRTRKSRK